MRVKLGSVAFLVAAGSGYGIGLTDDGHRIEFLGDWRALSELQTELAGDEPVYTEVDQWQVLAVDDVLRLPLNRAAMAERARYIRSAVMRDSQVAVAPAAERDLDHVGHAGRVANLSHRRSARAA